MPGRPSWSAVSSATQGGIFSLTGCLVGLPGRHFPGRRICHVSFSWQYSVVGTEHRARQPGRQPVRQVIL
ncbi:hypothetical protein Dimus_033582, partial [Dionaea muscipula]